MMLLGGWRDPRFAAAIGGMFSAPHGAICATLLPSVMRANIEALELSQKNIELQKRVTELEIQANELEEKLVLTGEVFRDGDHVFRDGELGGFCSRCWDVEHMLVHVIFMNTGKGSGIRPGCPNCKIETRGRGQNPRMKAQL